MEKRTFKRNTQFVASTSIKGVKMMAIWRVTRRVKTDKQNTIWCETVAIFHPKHYEDVVKGDLRYVTKINDKDVFYKTKQYTGKQVGMFFRMKDKTTGFPILRLLAA